MSIEVENEKGRQIKRAYPEKFVSEQRFSAASTVGTAFSSAQLAQSRSIWSGR